MDAAGRAHADLPVDSPKFSGVFLRVPALARKLRGCELWPGQWPFRAIALPQMHYLPLKAAGRFCKKALTPSMKSSVIPADFCA